MFQNALIPTIFLIGHDSLFRPSAHLVSEPLSAKNPFPSHFLFIFLKGKRSLSVSIAATLALPGFMKRYRRFNQSAVPPVTLSSEAI